MSDTENNVQEQSVDNPKRGTWIRARSGVTMYLGRVHLFDGVCPYKLLQSTATTSLPREEVPVLEVTKAARAGLLALMPVYDFMADMRRVPVKGPDGRVVMDGQVPVMGLAREPVTAGPDFLLHQTPVHLLNVDNIYFFSQMHADDVRVYWTFIDAAEERCQQMRMEMAGLAMPNEPARRGPRL
jgi:hypothetical protein